MSRAKRDSCPLCGAEMRVPLAEQVAAIQREIEILSDAQDQDALIQVLRLKAAVRTLRALGRKGVPAA